MPSTPRDSSDAAADCDVVVRAISTFIPEESDLSNPSDKKYVFAYQIEIENRGTRTVQLLSRHWWITDAWEAVREVEGDGVVGQQPVIVPGQVFTYSSWCVLPTSSGTMRGTYKMVTTAGEQIQVPVPPFGLTVPSLLN